MTFLSASPRLKMISFDLATHRYASAARDALRSLFPDRIEIINGDSRDTIPAFAKERGEQCDLLSVDGGHGYDVAVADLANFRALASDRNLVLMDDVACGSHFCKEPQKAWDEAKKRGWVDELGCFPTPDGLRGFCVGRYRTD